ncbi:MAG: Omp28-related outer membrane protein [Muribaculaceae bacterium]|nr:Omp28-related outer membrane protein [Muribaculaceae bacterium]
MKRTLLSLMTVALTVTGISAQSFVTPTYFEENFIKMGQTHDYVSDGWTTYGVDAPVVDILEQFYPSNDPEVNPYVILTIGNLSFPMAATNFTPPTEADQWLISPEIEIPEDANESVLSFLVAVYGGTVGLGAGTNPFKVYVSETGTAKEDFGDPIFEGAVRGSQTTEVVQKEFAIPFNGYGGKKIHLAIVAGGMNVGMTGFTNISLGNYYASFENKTPVFGEVGNKYTPKINVKLKTPVACPGITVIPYLNDVKQESVYYKKSFGNATSSPSFQLVELKDYISIDNNETVFYQFDIIPDYEGAPTSKVFGSINIPEYSYPNNVVVEEVTASGCGWCPSGIGSLEYYHDTYPGTETQGKVIGIGIHGYVNYYDPMSEGVSEYLYQVVTLNEYTGYPQAIFNRSTRALQPHSISAVEQQIEEKSYSQAEITSVEVPEVGEGETVHGKEVKVKFDVRNGYSGQGIDLSACVVLLENGVTGNNSGYSQENYLYNRDRSFINSNYGAWLYPYVEKYCVGGELAVDQIPFEKMVYNHVARGIYPGFFGEKLSSEWKAGETQSFDLKFTVPQTIQNWENTEVIVLLIRNTIENNVEKYPIVGSDNFKAADYTTVSGVKVVTGDDGSIARDGENIVITAENGSVVTLYNVEGMNLGRYTVTEGRTAINVAELNGMVIVKVDSAKGTVSRKLVF